MIGYLSITCHFLLDNFTTTDYLLQVRELPGSHTGELIGDAIDSCLQEFNLINKNNFLVTDNASNMKASAQATNMTHIGCAAHLINLIVRNALEIPEIKAAVEELKQVCDCPFYLNCL
jgi:hypothetical protein